MRQFACECVLPVNVNAHVSACASASGGACVRECACACERECERERECECACARCSYLCVGAYLFVCASVSARVSACLRLCVRELRTRRLPCGRGMARAAVSASVVSESRIRVTCPYPSHVSESRIRVTYPSHLSESRIRATSRVSESPWRPPPRRAQPHSAAAFRRRIPPARTSARERRAHAHAAHGACTCTCARCRSRCVFLPLFQRSMIVTGT